MPRLDGAQERLYHGSQEAGHRVASAWEGFTDWVFSDNVLEVAIGLMYACLKGPYIPADCSQHMV